MKDTNKLNPEIRFSGFTDDWEQRKLSDIYRDIGNAFVGTATPYYVEEGHFYLESNNVKDGQINHNTEVFINDEFYEKQKDKWLHTGDMVMVQSGHVGHAAVIPEELDCSAAHALIMFRNPKVKIEPYFLNYQYQTVKAKKKIENITTGNTIQHILASEMQKFIVDVASYDEQEKIAGFFSHLDNLITLHQRKLDLLKEQKKGFLQKMFPKNGAKVPELRFAGFADDWEERKLGEVIDIENGYAFKSEYFSDEEKRHIVLTPGSVKIGGGFQKDKGRYYDVSGVFPEKFIFKPGNIFITMTDLTPTAQSLGYPAIVPRDDNVYLHNQRLGKIINNTTNPEFLYTLLTTDTYHKEIVSSASGTTVKHSSVSKILDFKSAIPNIDEQKLIGSFFKELDNTIALHQRKLDKLKTLKKAMLEKMFI